MPTKATTFVGVIKPSLRGNTKLGENVLTESRPTGPTCPDSCPLKATAERLEANKTGAKIPLCYSHDTAVRRPSVAQGMTDRLEAWASNRAGWRAKRLKEWRTAAIQGFPVRFNVHGDILKPYSTEIDREWLSDIIRVARQIPCFAGWIYTHAWRELPTRTLRALNRVGIAVWASVHNHAQARLAAGKGFRVAFISKEPKKGYAGPKYTRAFATGRPAIVCPEQIGTKESCESCRFCFAKVQGPVDLILLTH